jgi:hypothetical protein
MDTKKIIKKYLLNPRLIPATLASLAFSGADDETYLKILFPIRTGYVLNLKNPQTFNEKLQFLKLYRYRPEYTQMTDKLAVRRYVKERIGEDLFPKIYGEWINFSQIDFEKLPDNFVLKTNHDSGSVLIVRDKSKLDIKKEKKLFDKSISKNFYKSSRERPYKDIMPKIFAEEFLHDDIIDYKLMCFNGKVKCSFTCSERKTGLKVTWYDYGWNRMPFERLYPSSKADIKKPVNYNKMIEIAERLSSGMEFLRVDFYEENSRAYLSELTFYPGAGMEFFRPFEWDKRLGDWLDIKMEARIL